MFSALGALGLWGRQSPLPWEDSNKHLVEAFQCDSLEGVQVTAPAVLGISIVWVLS